MSKKQLKRSTDLIRNDCHDDIISVKNVSFSYEYRPIHERLNLTVLERDFVGIIGSNGSGKTTLLRMLVGLLKPTEGEIHLFGQPISQFNEWDRIGYVPQKTAFNPLFPATVEEIVQSGLFTRKKWLRKVTTKDRKKCFDAMTVMGIKDLQKQKIGQLSGGQQQRVFLARALVNSPDLLILDEPTVGIDAETQIKFFQMIRHMHKHHNITFLMVSHDLEAMHAYLGDEPSTTHGKLEFFIKHSHAPEDCKETDLLHSLSDLQHFI